MAVTNLNHAVLYVRDAATTSAFYQDVLGFVVVTDIGPGRAVFLRAGGSDNHHDLGLFTVGAQAGPPTTGRSAGLYHLAWEVESIDELAVMKDRLTAAGALVGASDHGVSKSLYAKDPDGIEFEVLWTVPREDWGDNDALTTHLDLDAELARYGVGAE